MAGLGKEGAPQPAQQPTIAAKASGPALAPPSAAEAAGAQAPFTYYFLSELLGAPVRQEGQKRAFGRLRDIGARDAGINYPLASCLDVAGRGYKRLTVPWADVAQLSRREIVVRSAGGEGSDARFWLRRDVLDDQVVDVWGAKVHRVNDIHMLYAEGQLIVAHVEVGMRGLLRRIGIERPAVALVQWLLDYTIRDSFVSWRNLEMLNPSVFSGELRASAAPSQLAEIHPAELADIMQQLGVRDRQTLFSRLSVETAAEALREVDPETQRTLIAHQQPDRAADILEEMRPKEAADLLRDLHVPDAQSLLSQMEKEAGEDVRAILAHGESSAGGSLETVCIEARPEEAASVVLNRVRTMAEEVGVFNYVYVLDEQGHLVGVLSLRELLRAQPDAPLRSLMSTYVVRVAPETSLSDLARLFGKYGFRAIPVVDERNVFVGAVRLSSVLARVSPLFRQ